MRVAFHSPARPPVHFGAFQLIEKSTFTPSEYQPWPLNEIPLSEAVQKELGITAPFAKVDGLHLKAWAKLQEAFSGLSGNGTSIHQETKWSAYNDLFYTGVSPQDLKNNQALGQDFIDQVILALARHPKEPPDRTQTPASNSQLVDKLRSVIGLPITTIENDTRSSLLVELERIGVSSEERQRIIEASAPFEKDLQEISRFGDRYYFWAKPPVINVGAQVRCMLQGPPDGKPALEILKTIKTMSKKRFFLGRWLSPGVKRDKLYPVASIRNCHLLLEMFQQRGLIKIRQVFTTSSWHEYRIVLTKKGEEALTLTHDPIKALGLSDTEVKTYLQEELQFLEHQNERKQRSLQRLAQVVENRNRQAFHSEGALNLLTSRLAKAKKTYSEWSKQFSKERSQLEMSLLKLKQAGEMERLKTAAQDFDQIAKGLSAALTTQIERHSVNTPSEVDSPELTALMEAERILAQKRTATELEQIRSRQQKPS